MASLEQSSVFYYTFGPTSPGLAREAELNRADPYGYWYWVVNYAPEASTKWYASGSSAYIYDTYEDAVHDIFFLLDAKPVTVSAGSISIPSVGDYDDDDGLLIDGVGSWGDSLSDVWDTVTGLTVPDVTSPSLTWEATLLSELVDSLVDVGVLTTENSPGFYNGLPLVGGIPDLQFGNLWHYVTDWVSSMSGGLSLIGGIMFSLPFVAAFYALVVILLVLSLWRLLRSA